MKAYMAAWDANVPPIEGASQRLHEDTQRFSKGIDTYAAVLLNSACTLAAFTPILLSLGERVLSPPLLSSFGRSWMLVSAVLSALIGLGVAMFTGRHLVELEVANQRVEAELRRDLVVLETTPDAICETEAVEAEGGTRMQSPVAYFPRLWTALALNYQALFRNFFALNIWLDAFDQVMVLAPYVLVAPLLFAADPAQRITLGTLMQATNSFDKVFASLSVVSENWGGINEWRSTYVRLRQFEAELLPSNRPATADKGGTGSRSVVIGASGSTSESELSPILASKCR